MTAVLAFHLDRLPGGNLGVDAFFVLSGWLITSLLLNEAKRSDNGAIDLRRFWSARIRRLLPASLVVIVAVSVIWTVGHIDVPSLRRDGLWAIGWSSNWGTISGGGDYWARFGEPSPLAHFWSLAVEAQLYLGWPLLVVALARLGARHRDVAVAVASAALAIASAVFMAVTFDPSQPTATYLNTFARAHSLLIGAAAAAATAALAQRGSRARVNRWGFRSAALVAGLMVLTTSQDSDWLFSWGFPVFGLAMAVVVMEAAGGTGANWLAAPGLRWVGDRSYGIYLWHWPVILLLSPDRSPVSGGLLDLVRVVTSVALAAMSYRWLEMPIRRHRRLYSWWAPGLTLGALAATAAVIMVRVPTPPDLTSASIVTLPPVAAATSTSTSTSLQTFRSLSSLPTDVYDFVVPSSRGPRPPVRVLVTGDSTAVHLAQALMHYAVAHSDRIVAGSASHTGCGLTTVATDGRLHEISQADGTLDLINLSGCTALWASIVDRVASAEQIDIVLVHIGYLDGVNIHLPDGRIVSVGDPVGRQTVVDSYSRFVADVEGAGARVMWITPPNLHLLWGEIDAPINEARRWSALREIIDDLPVEQIDLHKWLIIHGLNGPEGRPDGVHLAPEVNVRFMTDVVVPKLIALP